MNAFRERNHSFSELIVNQNACYARRCLAEVEFGITGSDLPIAIASSSRRIMSSGGELIEAYLSAQLSGESATFGTAFRVIQPSLLPKNGIMPMTLPLSVEQQERLKQEITKLGGTWPTASVRAIVYGGS